jgi:acetate kinase
VKQVACFDSAFHKDLPTVAKMLPIPRKYYEAGVHRLGFHGISYSYLLMELRRIAWDEAANGKVILAHLGSGASMAAVSNGKPIDTSMAFTPLAGIVMGTRPGDLDPGLLVYLLRSEKMSADQLDDLLNKKCGLIGMSDTSADVRDLIHRRSTDPRAAEALDLFCYSARKMIGGYAAALGGVDTLVFSAGIGEHAPEIRSAICSGLGFLGVTISSDANQAGAPVISTGRVMVRVIATDEEAMIARTVIAFVKS